MRAYFFGAGSSAGTLETWPERPPVSADCGKALKERHPVWELQYPGLAEVAQHLGVQVERLSLEDLCTYIDYSAKLGSVLSSGPRWNPLFVWDLKRALLGLYGAPCVQAASQVDISLVYARRSIHQLHSARAMSSCPSTMTPSSNALR